MMGVLSMSMSFSYSYDGNYITTTTRPSVGPTSHPSSSPSSSPSLSPSTTMPTANHHQSSTPPPVTAPPTTAVPSGAASYLTPGLTPPPTVADCTPSTQTGPSARVTVPLQVETPTPTIVLTDLNRGILESLLQSFSLCIPSSNLRRLRRRRMTTDRFTSSTVVDGVAIGDATRVSPTGT